MYVREFSGDLRNDAVPFENNVRLLMKFAELLSTHNATSRQLPPRATAPGRDPAVGARQSLRTQSCARVGVMAMATSMSIMATSMSCLRNVCCRARLSAAKTSVLQEFLRVPLRSRVLAAGRRGDERHNLRRVRAKAEPRISQGGGRYCAAAPPVNDNVNKSPARAH